MRNSGNPRCPNCNGAGGQMVDHRWRKCSCVTGTPDARAAMQRLHSIGTDGKRLFPWRKP